MKYLRFKFIAINIRYSLYLFLLIGIYSCTPSSNGPLAKNNTTSPDIINNTNANFRETWLGTLLMKEI
jgi:hypothetical protein